MPQETKKAVPELPARPYKPLMLSVIAKA